MKPNSTTTGILLLVFAAGVGYLMVTLPPQIISHYETISEVGEVWGYIYLGVVAIGGMLLVGSSAWIVVRLYGRTRKKHERRRQREKSPSALSAGDRQKEIEENIAAIGHLKADPQADVKLRANLAALQERFEEKRVSQKLEIVAFGEISSGKSSILNMLAGREVFRSDLKGGTTVRRNEIPWPGIDKVVLVDTPGLGEVDGEENVQISAEAARDADVILLVVDGPLHYSVFQLLERLGQMEKRVIVCLNKSDWYTPREQEELIGQIAEQAKDFVKREDVVAVRAQPARRLRVRVLPSGKESEEHVEVSPDITPLAGRMMKVVKREGADLLLANLLLQSRGLVEQARRQVKDSLDERAWRVVDRYMWGAAGAAALSPFPVVDIAAGCAISTKMVVDLGTVYQQDIDLNAAVSLLGQLGKNLIGIVGANVAGPFLASALASMLKTVPGVGTIAGGVLQGAVQALITRWIGAVFIAYFREEMQAPEGGLTALARREWNRLTTVNELRKLVQTARQKYVGGNRKAREEAQT